MKLYTRGRKKLTLPVYDSKDELLTACVESQAVSPRVVTRLECLQSGVVVGDWWEYDDSRVAEVLGAYFNEKRGRCWIVRTILGSFYVGKKSPVYSVFLEGSGHLGKKRPLSLEDVDARKLRFLESWLFGGKKLAEAVEKHLMVAYNREYKYNHRSEFSKKRFAYRVLSGPWFQKVLDENRVIRERYMNLVGAFDAVGLTKDYLAAQLKKAITEGSEKERINALNKALEVVTAEEHRRLSSKFLVPVGAQWKAVQIEEEVEHIKQLEEAHASTEAVNQPDQVQSDGKEVAQDLGGEVGESQQVNRGEPSAEEVNSADEEAQVGDYDEEIQQIRQEIYAQENPPQRSFST